MKAAYTLELHPGFLPHCHLPPPTPRQDFSFSFVANTENRKFENSECANNPVTGRHHLPFMSLHSLVRTK